MLSISLPFLLSGYRAFCISTLRDRKKESKNLFAVDDDFLQNNCKKADRLSPMNNLTIISAMLLSILWHEACHALALLVVGVKVRVVQIGAPVVYRRGNLALGLFPFYGSIGADLTGVSRVMQAFYYVSGPIGSLLLGVLIYTNNYFLQMVGVISLVMGFFNALPIPPLDGYRLFTISVKVPYRVQVFWAALGWMAIVGAMLLQR